MNTDSIVKHLVVVAAVVVVVRAVWVVKLPGLSFTITGG
jgi:hypothetical protein